jgi:hypothetical protein
MMLDPPCSSVVVDPLFTDTPDVPQPNTVLLEISMPLPDADRHEPPPFDIVLSATVAFWTLDRLRTELRASEMVIPSKDT